MMVMINNYCCSWWAKPRGHFCPNIETLLLFFQWEGMEVILRVELGLESTHLVVRGRRRLLLLQADAGIVVRVRGEAMHETQVWNRVDSWKPKRRDGCVV